MLVEEARVVSEQDLASAVQMLEEAYAIDPDPELMNEILLRKDALRKLDQARDRFWSRYREDKLYSAYQILLGLPDNYRFDQEEGILADLKERFTEAEKLVKQAKSMPAIECQKALDTFRKAAELMPDFPGLASEISALEKTVEQGNAYLIAITRAIEKGELSRAKSLLRRYRDGYGDDDNARLLEKQIARRTGDMQRTRSLRRIAAALFFVLSAILAAAGMVVFHDYRSLEKADELWRQVKEDRVAGRFADAVRKSKEIVSLINRVYLLDLPRRELLDMQARQFLASRHSREGMAGRMLVDGTYVSRGLADEARRLENHLIAAEESMSLGDPGGAAVHYEKALVLARRLKDKRREELVREGLDKARSAVIRARITSIADGLEPGGEEAALAAYRSLKKDVERYGLTGTPVARLLDSAFMRAASARLKRLESAADEAYAGGDFDSAARLWQEAVDFAAANGAAGPQRLNSLKIKVSRALVVSVVRQADRMRQEGRLADALAAYRNAVAMGRKRGLAGFAPLGEAERQAAELASAIDADFVKKQLAESRRALDNGDLAASGRALAAAKQRLAASDLAATGALAGLSRQVSALEEELSARRRVEEERDYLKKNHIAILRKAFGLPRDSALLNPEIVMIGEESGRRLWSITAYSYEKKGDSENYIAYHVSYARNLDDGSWSVESSDREVRSGPEGG